MTAGTEPVAAPPHVPVLLQEVLAELRPAPGETILDGTFGAGGYSRAILAAGAKVIGVDRDPDAIAAGQALVDASQGALSLRHGPFSSLDAYSGQGKLDGVVLDIGVSSMQLDRAERGFSFRHDGPLDMRMARSGASAADVVNRAAVSDLTRIFGILGEERHAPRIARAIEARRRSQAFNRTADLAALVETTIGRNPKDRIHPATRVFQALRIFVNDELGELARALFAAERALKPGGRLVVVTFHSLEDRIVKRFLSDRSGGSGGGSRHLPPVDAAEPTFTLSRRSVVVPSEAECEANPRARSAKLRSAERTDAPARREEMALFGFARFPQPADFE